MHLLDVVLEVIEPCVGLCARRALERLCIVNLEMFLQIVVPRKRVVATALVSMWLHSDERRTRTRTGTVCTQNAGRGRGRRGGRCD